MNDFFTQNTKLVFAFRQTLDLETDRGCALMAASFLESELEKVLKDKLVGTAGQINELFEFNGPLGTFSSKIKMAFCIGVINKQTLNDLDLIRRIRNEFGHDHEPIDFVTNKIKSRIDNLTLHFYEKGDATPRKIFTNAVLGNLALIHGAYIRIKKFKESKEVNYTQEMKNQAKNGESGVLSKLLEVLNDKSSQDNKSVD